MPLALQCVLHWVERSELSWAVCELFCFFFWSRKKNVSESPPPPPPPSFEFAALFFFFFFWPLCLFLDGLGAFLLSQSALWSLKCPFWKWPCPSKSLIRALEMMKSQRVLYRIHTLQKLLSSWLSVCQTQSLHIRHWNWMDIECSE